MFFCLTIVFFVALVTRCKLKKSFIKMSCSTCDGYGTFKTPSLSGVTCGEPRQKERLGQSLLSIGGDYVLFI